MIDKMNKYVDVYGDIKSEIGNRIIGNEEIVEKLLIAVFVGGNVLLEGAPGLGKTELVKSISQVLDLDFKRIQFTPDLMPSDIIGSKIANYDNDGKLYFEFQRGPVFTNILLADEINRATPKTQSALLQAMQEKQVTTDGGTIDLQRPYFVLATQNPIEMEGTYPLPEAQLDRFIFKLKMKSPDNSNLMEIVKATMYSKSVELRKLIEASEINEVKEILDHVVISDAVLEYAIRIVNASNPEHSNLDMVKKYVMYGSSPRGAQGLIAASKALALFRGRKNVSFDDVRYLAKDVLNHRIILNFNAMRDELLTEDIIDAIVERTPME